MFTRQQSSQGLVIYQSDLLTRAGVIHGFSTRHAPSGNDLDLAAGRTPALSRHRHGHGHRARHPCVGGRLVQPRRKPGWRFACDFPIPAR